MRSGSSLVLLADYLFLHKIISFSHSSFSAPIGTTASTWIKLMFWNLFLLVKQYIHPRSSMWALVIQTWLALVDFQNTLSLSSPTVPLMPSTLPITMPTMSSTDSWENQCRLFRGYGRIGIRMALNIFEFPREGKNCVSSKVIHISFFFEPGC